MRRSYQRKNANSILINERGLEVLQGGVRIKKNEKMGTVQNEMEYDLSLRISNAMSLFSLLKKKYEAIKLERLEIYCQTFCVFLCQKNQEEMKNGFCLRRQQILIWIGPKTLSLYWQQLRLLFILFTEYSQKKILFFFFGKKRK